MYINYLHIVNIFVIQEITLLDKYTKKFNINLLSSYYSDVTYINQFIIVYCVY